MFNKTWRLKLKSQLILLISISIIIIIAMLVILQSWFGSINKSNYAEFMEDSIQQIELKAISFSQEINDIVNFVSFNDVTHQFIHSQDIGERLRLSKHIQVMIEPILLSSQSINDIIVSDLDLIHIGNHKSENFWILRKVNELYQSGQIEIDSPSHYVLYDDERDKRFYVSIVKSFTSQATNRSYIVILIYNIDTFIQSLANIQQKNEHSFIMIADHHDHIIASNRNDLTDINLDEILAKRETPLDYKLSDRGESLTFEKTVKNLNWRIIGMTTIDGIDGDLLPLKQFSILMGLVTTIVLLGFGFIINRNITSPISQIVRFMNSVGHSYSTRRLIVNKGNEISLLARVLNKMLDNIDEMTKKMVDSQKKLYKAEISKKNAQFSAFQSQVNPHFLYNTLDCIRSIALSRGVPEIFDVTTSMAKIFRYSIKESNYVKVSDEIACIQDYFKIIQIRQSNRFSIRCEIENSIMDCIIPKMILQPLVENAVFHGLEQKKGKGTLSIYGYAVGGDVINFEIKDDGKGMSAEVMEQLRKHIASWDPLVDQSIHSEKSGIGIVNIDSRIKLLYGESYGISINSFENKGTTVTVKLPNKNQNPILV